jgi:hypothetical protein
MKKILLALICLSLLSSASLALAQTTFDATGKATYTPLEPLPGVQSDAQSGNNFPAFVSSIFKIFITFGALFAVVMLVIAGIGYMVSESAVDISKAKDRAKAALWGLVLLTACYLILNTINPNLLQFNTLLNSINVLKTPSGVSPQTSVRNNAPPTQQQINQCGGRIRPLPQGGYDCL